ncbi:MAG: hypothetical protein ACK478_11470 [Flavobacteriales bacterium]
MTDTVLYSLLLTVGFSGWIWSASPFLKYLIYAAEKDYRWPLGGWFGLLTCCLFIMKFSLYSLTLWPQPESIASRLFYPVGLFGSYLIPFILEYLRSAFRK